MEESTTNSSNRKVCFGKNWFVLIESRAEFSKKERQQSWFSEAELKMITLRSLEEAARLESSCTSLDLKAKKRMRGLEGLTTEGSGSASTLVDACVEAVMDEQEIQWENNIEDCKRLALASQQVSRECIDMAIMRALLDERVARKIYRTHAQKKRVSPPTLPSRRVSRDDVVWHAKNVISSELVQIDDPCLISKHDRQIKSETEQSKYAISPGW